MTQFFQGLILKFKIINWTLTCNRAAACIIGSNVSIEKSCLSLSWILASLAHCSTCKLENKSLNLPPKQFEIHFILLALVHTTYFIAWPQWWSFGVDLAQKSVLEKYYFLLSLTFKPVFQMCLKLTYKFNFNVRSYLNLSDFF